MIITSENGVVDLGEMTQTAMVNLVQSGKIEEMIAAALEKTLHDIVGEQLRSYSALGKKIRAAVDDAFGFDPNSIMPGEYGAMIANLVQTRLREYMVKDGEQQLATMLDEILEAAPAETKFSELVKELKDDAVNDYRFERDKPEVTVIVESSTYSSRWVAMDPRPGKGRYDCEITFLLSQDGSIGVLEFKDYQRRKFIGRYRGLERTLFWLHSGRTKLIMDEFETTIDEQDLPEECHC